MERKNNIERHFHFCLTELPSEFREEITTTRRKVINKRHFRENGHIDIPALHLTEGIPEFGKEMNTQDEWQQGKDTSAKWEYYEKVLIPKIGR